MKTVYIEVNKTINYHDKYKSSCKTFLRLGKKYIISLCPHRRPYPHTQRALAYVASAQRALAYVASARRALAYGTSPYQGS